MLDMDFYHITVGAGQSGSSAPNGGNGVFMGQNKSFVVALRLISAGTKTLSVHLHFQHVLCRMVTILFERQDLIVQTVVR